MTIGQLIMCGCLVIGCPAYVYATESKVHDKETQLKSDDITDNEFLATEKANVQVQDSCLQEEDDAKTFDLSKLASSEWCYPLHDGKVISPFGNRRRHMGVDIKSFAGDTIHAAFAGRVRLSKRYFGYGNLIILGHSKGMETYYSHNARNFVHVGDSVKAGEPIAIVGRTGKASTEHLHFEIRIDGKAYDPTYFFDMQARCLRNVVVSIDNYGRLDTTRVSRAKYLSDSISERK